MKLIAVLYIIFGFLLCSCADPNPPSKKADLSFEIDSVKGDEIIQRSVFFENYIICLMESRIIVFDTLLHRNDSLSDRLSSENIKWLYERNDTVWAVNENHIYFIDKAFNLIKSQEWYSFNSITSINYEDQTYSVSSCSNGEWGGIIFFRNKKNNITYTYPVTDAQQVLKIDSMYIVCSYLAHLSGISDYLFVPEPSDLYKIKNGDVADSCMNYCSIDSVIRSDTAKRSRIRHYRYAPGMATLITFLYNKEVYSISSTDSLTFLMKLENYTFVIVDTLMKRGIHFSYSSPTIRNDIITCSYNDHYWGGGSVNKNTLTEHRSTGILTMKGNKVKLLEIHIPDKEVIE